MKYLLDANVFIESSRSFYAQDFCPAFWEFLANQFACGDSGSIVKVYEELAVGGDSLTDWTKKTLGRTSFFDQSSDETVIDYYQKVFDHVETSEQYLPQAKRAFLASEEADPWLCAYAMANPGVVVVTQEMPDPKVRKRVPLPNILSDFGIPHINVYSFLRVQEARFVLSN